jgi:multidrug resistance efflux pump
MRFFGWAISAAVIIGTIIACAISVVVSHRRPLTDDASVRANIIGIAPHVSGPIVELHVVDNQPIHKGDLLFVVDPRPYQARLRQAEADLMLVEREIEAQHNAIASARQILRQRKEEYIYLRNYRRRLEPLLPRNFVTADKVEDAQTRERTAQAALLGSGQELDRATNLLAEYGKMNARREQAEARLYSARLDVDYCRVTAPFDGYVTNVNIAEGDYAIEGRQVFALVDGRSWYVIGNFRETFLRNIRPGMAAEVYVLDYPGRRLRGEVQGIGWAVQQRDGPGSGLLPPIEAELNWVRLAQRFAVRVRVIDLPPDLPLRVGQTAAVSVLSAP